MVKVASALLQLVEISINLNNFMTDETGTWSECCKSITVDFQQSEKTNVGASEKVNVTIWSFFKQIKTAFRLKIIMRSTGGSYRVRQHPRRGMES